MALRKLRSLVNLARWNRAALLAVLTGRVSVLKVYACDTTGVSACTSVPGAEFRRLSEDDLRTLDAGDAEFRHKQLDRLAKFGRSCAYGVFVGGRLAHISWLLSAAAARMETPPVLRLRDNQAEITACETLPEFRGKGIYGLAIGQIFGVARQQGILRIYMKTAWRNKASQRGILKAGLQGVGLAFLWTPPFLSGRTWVLWLATRF